MGYIGADTSNISISKVINAEWRTERAGREATETGNPESAETESTTTDSLAGIITVGLKKSWRKKGARHDVFA